MQPGNHVSPLLKSTGTHLPPTEIYDCQLSCHDGSSVVAVYSPHVPQCYLGLPGSNLDRGLQPSNNSDGETPVVPRDVSLWLKNTLAI